jgi:hypothetical protein
MTQRPGAGQWAAEEDGTDQYRLRGQMSLADRRLTVAEAGARQAGPRQG